MRNVFIFFAFLIAGMAQAQIITNVDKLRIRDVEQGADSDKILVIDSGNVVRWVDSVDSILEDYYTISEVDAFVADLEAGLLERYTKDEVDALLDSLELRLDEYYTKTEINGLLSNYYDIVEIDSLLDTKQDLLSQTDNEAIKNKINPVRINMGIGEKVALSNVNTNILEDAGGSQYFSVTDRKKGASYAGKIIGYANASTLSKLRFEFDLSQNVSYSNIIFESAEFDGLEQPFTLDYAIDFLEDNIFSISGTLQVGGKYINIPEMLGQSQPSGVREMRVQVRLSNSGDSGYVTKNLLELKNYKNDMVNMLIFGGQRKSIQVVTHNGMPYEVIWADGSSERVASGGIANNVGGLSDVVDFADRGNIKEIVIKEGFDFNISDFAYLDFLEGLEVELLKTNVSGDIANAPTSLTSLQILGSNTLTGDIANAPTSLTSLRITGSNTLTGDIANAPTSLTSLRITGSNTLSGDIANAPTSLTYLQILGSNTLTGDIANAPTSLTSLQISGSNTLTYSTRTWSNNQRIVLLRATNFDAQMLDQLLIDLSDASWISERSVDLRIGNNVQRTSASDNAVLLLQSKGVTVLTN